MQKFELFMCCLGNGLTLCNKAICRNGDYVTIGHISPAGNLSLYVSESDVPDDALQRIRKTANNMRVAFAATLDKDIEQQPGQVYERMLNVLTTTEFLDHVDRGGKGLETSIAALKPLYLARA